MSHIFFFKNVPINVRECRELEKNLAKEKTLVETLKSRTEKAEEETRELRTERVELGRTLSNLRDQVSCPKFNFIDNDALVFQ